MSVTSGFFNSLNGDKLYDNGYRTYSSDLVLDSNGDSISARVIFVTK